MDYLDFVMDLGSLLGAGVGFLSSNSSAKQQFKYQSRLQQQAYDLTQANYKEAPSNQRYGLEKAGFNPMLAVQNGTVGGNASFPAGQATGPDYSSGISAGVSNALSIQNMKNQTSQTESINDKNYAEADEAKARKSAILEKLPFISNREKAEIANVEKDSLMKEATIHNIDETTRFIEKDFELRKRLGEMGIDVQRYGIYKNYESSIYNANVLERNNKRDNRVKTTSLHVSHPFQSFLHKGYTSGKDYKGSYSDPWK